MNDPTTNTSFVRPAGEHRTPRRSRLRTTTLAVVVGGLVVATAGCGVFLRHDYSSFQSALQRGASCSELFDQRERFSDPETLAKVDADLAGIGCTSRGATRNDD